MFKLSAPCFLALLLVLHTSWCASADRIVLPLRFENNIPIVTLNIAGKALPFVLDTGADGGLYLTADAIAHIPRVQRTGKVIKSLDLGGKVASNDELVIQDLQVDGMNFGKVGGRTHTPWGVSSGAASGPPPISVLGRGFFEHKKVMFNFPDRQIVVWDAEATAPPEGAAWTRLPFDRSGEGVLVAMASASRTYRFVLDSASTISLVKRSSVAQDEKTESCDMQMAPDEPCRRIQVALPPGAPFHPVLMAMPAEFEADGIIGREFFDRYQVFLDSSRRALRVRSHQGQ